MKIVFSCLSLFLLLLSAVCEFFSSSSSLTLLLFLMWRVKKRHQQKVERSSNICTRRLLSVSLPFYFIFHLHFLLFASFFLRKRVSEQQALIIKIIWKVKRQYKTSSKKKGKYISPNNDFTLSRHTRIRKKIHKIRRRIFSLQMKSEDRQKSKENWGKKNRVKEMIGNEKKKG